MVQQVRPAEGSGLGVHMTGRGRIGLNIPKRAVFAHHRQRPQKCREHGVLAREIDQVVHHEVRRKESVASGAVALACAGDIQSRILQKAILEIEAGLYRVFMVLPQDGAQDIGRHAGMQVLADFQCDLGLFGERRGDMLSHLIFGCIKRLRVRVRGGQGEVGGGGNTCIFQGFHEGHLRKPARL